MRNIILVIALLLLTGCAGSYADVHYSKTNPYGGKNDKGYVDEYAVVAVFDTDGVLKCSYPIDDKLMYHEWIELGCPEDLDPKIFIGE